MLKKLKISTVCMLLLIGIMVLWVNGSYSKEAYDDIPNVVFLTNYDGDTITINVEGWPAIAGEWIPVRVKGVDTPERRGKCKNEKELAIIAKRFVYDELSQAKVINILEPSRGKYFRIVGDVEYDGKLLSEELISKGYAYPYDGGTKDNPWCE